MESNGTPFFTIRNIIIGVVIFLLVLGAVLFFVLNHRPQVEFTTYQFSYHVFCPLSSDKNLVKREHTFM